MAPFAQRIELVEGASPRVEGTQVIFRSAVSGSYELYSLPVPPPAAAANGSTGRTAPAPTQLTTDGMTKRWADWGSDRRRPATFALTTNRPAHGKVSSRPRGIACGADCAATSARGATIRLTAVPAHGFRFRQWAGACRGTDPSCTVRMNADRTAFARFVRIG